MLTHAFDAKGSVHRSYIVVPIGSNDCFKVRQYLSHHWMEHVLRYEVNFLVCALVEYDWGIMVNFTLMIASKLSSLPGLLKVLADHIIYDVITLHGETQCIAFLMVKKLVYLLGFTILWPW